jgi:hypothetical protein
MGEERYKLYLLARLYVIESRYESSKLFGGFQMKGNPERLQFRSHPGKEYNFNKTSPEEFEQVLYGSMLRLKRQLCWGVRVEPGRACSLPTYLDHFRRKLGFPRNAPPLK